MIASRFALVLTNSSGQPILGLTIRWTVNSGERTGIYDTRTDAFGQFAAGVGSSMHAALPLPGHSSPAAPTRPLGESYASTQGVVLEPGERLLVAPGLFVRESLARMQGRPAAASSMPEPLRSATAISVSVDTVILQDGTVITAILRAYCRILFAL